MAKKVHFLPFMTDQPSWPDKFCAANGSPSSYKSGNLKFKLTSGASPGHIVNILVYGEFQITRETDLNEAVIYDK